MKRLTIKEAKSKISIVAYLAKYGFYSVGMSGKRHRYKSIFREEKEPSMFVEDKQGLWNDFGHSGGSIIDLAMQMHGFSNIPQALEHLTVVRTKMTGSSNMSLKEVNFLEKSNSSITNIKVKPLSHFVLLKYLREERGIDERLAKKYLKLVWYDNKNKKNLFAIGWENDSGSFELRSAGKSNFKAVVGKKDISTIVYKSEVKTAFIFESMIDFLSALMMKQQDFLEGTVYVLNSTSLVKRVIPFLEKNKFELIHLFFDNDQAGTEAKKKLLAFLANPSVINIQTFYNNFNDVNEYWVNRFKK